jgi:1-acyl-sn-glycerol-3-phosphate acyltransferase
MDAGEGARQDGHPGPAAPPRGTVVEEVGVGAPSRSVAFRIAEGIVRPLVRLLTRHEWRGQEHVPRTGGCVVVVNHTSHADPFVVAHFLINVPRLPRFLGKEEVFRIPVAGRILRSAGQIPVYRETADASRSYSEAVAAVRAGECVVIYPEGTLTRDPDLWPMRGKTGAARVALETGCPVVPLAQWGSHRVLSPYGRALRLVPPQHVVVAAGPPVDLSAYAGRPLDAGVLAGATDAIMDALSGVVGEIRGAEPPTSRWDPREHGQGTTGNFRKGTPR